MNHHLKFIFKLSASSFNTQVLKLLADNFNTNVEWQFILGTFHNQNMKLYEYLLELEKAASNILMAPFFRTTV